MNNEGNKNTEKENTIKDYENDFYFEVDNSKESDYKEISEKYEDRKKDNSNFKNYKSNDSPDWYTDTVRILHKYTSKLFDFFANTKHGILYSFIVSGIITGFGNTAWLNILNTSYFSRLKAFFSSTGLLVVSLITIPITNYIITRFIYVFTKKYMRPVPPDCTRDIKGGVFSIVNAIFLVILTPLGFLGSIVGCFTGMLAYSASFFDLILDKDSFKTGLRALLAQLLMQILIFLIKLLMLFILALLVYGAFSSMMIN